MNFTPRYVRIYLSENSGAELATLPPEWREAPFAREPSIVNVICSIIIRPEI